MYTADSGWLDTARLYTLNITLNITNIINNRLQIEAGYMYVARLCSKIVHFFLLLPQVISCCSIDCRQCFQGAVKKLCAEELC